LLTNENKINMPGPHPSIPQRTQTTKNRSRKGSFGPRLSIRDVCYQGGMWGFDRTSCGHRENGKINPSWKSVALRSMM
jgi:hypothetical protein